MADKKQNRRNNKNYDDDYNPRFRKQRKKVCGLCSDKNFESKPEAIAELERIYRITDDIMKYIIVKKD